MNRSESKETFAKALKENTRFKGFCGSGEFDLYNVMLDLKEAVAQQAAKNSGKYDLRKAMMDILSRTDESRPLLRKAYYDEAEGKTVVTDSFSLIATTEKVDDLPMVQLEKDEKWLDYKRIMPKAYDMRQVKIPTAAELKAYIKLNKNNENVQFRENEAYNRLFYPLKNEKDEVIALFNAKRLLNLLEGIGKDVRAFVQWKGAALSPMLLVTETTEAIICPMRIYKSYSDSLEKRGFVEETKAVQLSA